MLVKCTLVVVYFAALFVVTRFLEFLGVLHRGMRCSEQPDDTRPLYTEQLRKVLDHRGISYRYVIERPELMALLNSSGGLSAGDLVLIDQQATDDEDVLLSLRYFQSAEEFVTSYLYPSVWLVQPLFIDNDTFTDWALNDRWLLFLRILHLSDISTCQINCTASYNYCHQYKWAHGRPVLVRPYDAQFMYYEAMKSNIDHRDSAAMTPSKVLDWLAARLSEHVHKITSVVELRRDWLHLEPGQRRRRTQQDAAQVNVIFCVYHSVNPPFSISRVPLFLRVLSIEFEGRGVKFAQVPHRMASQALDDSLPQQRLVVIVSTSEGVYHIYGSDTADCMTVDCMRLLLTQLAPSASDLLDLVITLSLLLVCLQPCLVCSGDIKSRLVSVWSFSLQLCFIALLYSFFVSYVIPEHELHLLLEDLLPAWRWVMLTWFGNMVRSDWLQYTGANFPAFLVTYSVYLALVGWVYGRLCRRRKAWACALPWNGAETDDVDLHKECLDYTWQQFGDPDYWLDAATGDSHVALSAGGSPNCAGCGGRLSYGSKVCRAPCQHVFHRRCLARLIYANDHDDASGDRSQCPACCTWTTASDSLTAELENFS